MGVVEFAFMGWVPLIPQSGVPEDTVLSQVGLYLQGQAFGFVLFSLCLTFMRNHWEWSQMPGASKGSGERASWLSALQ